MWPGGILVTEGPIGKLECADDIHDDVSTNFGVAGAKLGRKTMIMTLGWKNDRWDAENRPRDVGYDFMGRKLCHEHHHHTPAHL